VIPADWSHTDGMKNKNTVVRTINETVDLMVDLQHKKGNREFAQSYALGACMGIINSAKWMDLQLAINDTYDNIKVELDAWERGVHALQS
jgi:hypothetical protein